MQNAGQADRDGDGVGDACDPQTCGNGAVEGNEACDGGACCTASCTLAADGSSCNDANACTRVDRCRQGACVGTDPIVCSAADQCHVAGTCQPSTGTCSQPVRPDGSSCDDGDACSTGDACTAGRCAGSPMNCDDSNPCTTDACAQGACVNAPNTLACSDGDACTGGERCAGGQCGGGLTVDCDDHNACTADGCDALAGCGHTPIEGCVCRVAECSTCSSQCGAAADACSSGCLTSFTSCLSGCTQTYCAAFCQADYAQCLSTCPAPQPCRDACDAGSGCDRGCRPFTAQADGDGDGVPDEGDNCSADANPDQADLDQDGLGDVCDPVDAALASATVMVRPGPAGAGKSRVTANGTFAARSGDGVDASAGVAVYIALPDGSAISAAWAASECKARSATQVACKSADRTASATFRANRSGVWSYKVTLSRLTVARSAMPTVTVRIRHGARAIDRVAEPAACTSTPAATRCRTR